MYKYLSLLLVLPPSCYAILPIYPAEVIARDLSVPGASWAGHIGLATAEYVWQDAEYVIEALNADVVLQTNYIPNFKLLSPYWGSRYGIIANKSDAALNILRAANFQRQLGCSKYTLMPVYDYSEGYWNGIELVKTHCGTFRCDTFVTYSYGASAILPTWVARNQMSMNSVPVVVFNAFPKGNGDGPKAPQNVASKKTTDYDFKSLDTNEMNNLADDDFYYLLVNTFKDNNAINTQYAISLILDKNLNLERRNMLLDCIAPSLTVDAIPALIELHSQLDKSQELLKNQILVTLQVIYQKTDMTKHPEIAGKLVKFFELAFNNEFKMHNDVAIRGLINLTDKSYMRDNVYKILTFINSSKIPKEYAIKLQFEISFRHPTLENRVIKNIITILEKENDVQLDDIFNAFVVHKLSNVGVNGFNESSKDMINTYLASSSFKYNSDNKLIKNNGVMTPFSRGAWLEAYALTSSSSKEEAQAFIKSFLNVLPKADKELFTVGLSALKAG